MAEPSHHHPAGRLKIIGLGNELLSDDGVGIDVVRRLRTMISRRDPEYEELPVGGIGLLDHLCGCDECFIVDAVTSGVRPPGTMYRFVRGGSPQGTKITSSHQVDLEQVLSLGAVLGADLPQKVVIYGIEAEDITTFHDQRTPGVAAAVPKLAAIVSRDAETGVADPDGAGGWQILGDPDLL